MMMSKTQIRTPAALILAFVLTAGMVIPWAIASDADQPTTQAAESPKEVVKLRDIADIKLNDDGLLVVSSNKTGARPILNEPMQIEGFHGKTLVRITPLSFWVMNQTGADIATSELAQSIIRSPNNCIISRQLHVRGQPDVVVSLLQAYKEWPAMGDSPALPAGQVQLFCQVGKPGEQPAVKVRASSFRQLRLEQPEAVDEFFRPILQDMQIENLLIPTDTAAKLVLNDEALQPTDLQATVKKLVQQFNGDDFKEREKADRQLRSLGEPAVKVLKAMDHDKLTPEQQARVAAIVAGGPKGLENLSWEQVQHLRTSIHFLLDCLNSDDGGIRASALAQLEKLTDKKVEFDLKADGETRAKAIAALRANLTDHPEP